MALQTDYQQYIGRVSDDADGQVASTAPREGHTAVFAKVANAAAPYDTLPFGVVVRQGPSEGEVAVLDGDSKDGTHNLIEFVGIVQENRTFTDSRKHYKDGENVSVMTKGEIWVRVEGAVAVGDDVTVRVVNNATTNANHIIGRLGSNAAGANYAKIPRMRWMTAATDGKLAVLRIGTDMVGGA